jgi:hydroxymethylglutaryl-CoA reductase
VIESRISGFYRLEAGRRIDELERLGWLSATDAAVLRAGRHVLLPSAADRIIENVIGVFGLPLAIAPNFMINGADRLVPMVVEEPSIVAGLSFAAALARSSGGFHASCEESLLAGQIHLTHFDDAEVAIRRIESAGPDLIAAANRVHPRLVERGGGVREIEVRRLQLPDGEPAIAVHLLVDTCDAMGANLVNTICEAVAPQAVEVCGGNVAMRILSNLTDRSLVTATVRYGLGELADSLDGAAVRDAIVTTSDIAAVDPYRAATHNKGVMNGIDAVALATGNDWRALEAGAHAFAAIDGQYRPLSRWTVADDGDLVGEICVPLKVGIVGGTLAANPAAALGIRIAGVSKATELAEMMAAVGLAQNFAAVRALATTGIQHGHMRLHARSAAVTAGASDAHANEATTPQGDAPAGTAVGKVILLGEHAVVYGKHALALPIPGAVTATVSVTGTGLSLVVPNWELSRDIQVDSGEDDGVDAAVRLILRELGIDRDGFAIHVRSSLPRAMGLGSSAALAVAIVRAFDVTLKLGLDDARINEVAFECEKLAHGTPSGVDNTLATYARPMLFRKSDKLLFEELELIESPPLVIASSGRSGMTHEQVAGVRARYDQNRAHYTTIFDQIDGLSIDGAAALGEADYMQLGSLMNICNGLLNAIGVSTPELEHMIGLARHAGAIGAKLTGAGGGGSIVALCPGVVDEVSSALASAGYRTITLTSGRDAV